MNAEAEIAVPTADLPSGETDLSLQFVTFYLNGELFAVEMAPVQEIIRVPHTVRVPLAPSSLEGLANLRGRVLPIIQLRRIFNYGLMEHDDSTRALVIDFGSPLGFEQALGSCACRVHAPSAMHLHYQQPMNKSDWHFARVNTLCMATC